MIWLWRLKMNKRVKAYKKGHFAESYAALYLRLKGYKILERRYKTKMGEIDLIAQKGEVIAAVEVKARTSYKDALESVSKSSQIRIQRALEYYISTSKNGADKVLRFDIVTVYGGFFLRHLDNAWLAAT